ncbi:hypothetical protein [Streptomyces sp. MNP-20]|uniref:hypothetical protein n=1 Tax=Streptomyces sp. MNP-20 TaxID=2721165 RepID=UPI001553837F|nr:hypothetical protein [Streptomyces sp. MNP-20]
MNPLSVSAREPLADILSAALPRTGDGQSEDSVVAHWLRTKQYPQSDTWNAAQWAHHLDDPTWAYPPAPDHAPAIWHAVVHRQADGPDSPLSVREWREVAYRLVRAARLDQSDAGHECRWIALQPRPDRLDLLVSLVRGDGSLAEERGMQPELAAECRRITSELRRPPAPGNGKSYAANTSEPCGQPAGLADPAAPHASQHETPSFAVIAHRLLDETFEHLATMRRHAEDAAYLLSDVPYAYGPEAGHRLELIARRLHGIQQDLEATTADLSADREHTDALPLPPCPRTVAAHRTR